MKAHDILTIAAGHMRDKAVTYDRPEGERSMGATVEAFRAVSGVTITEEQGWLFMALLKAVRSQQGAYKGDSYEDGAAYFALAGESAALTRQAIHAQAVPCPRTAGIMPASFGQQNMIEPAAAIDDESPRSAIIGQSGEMAEEVYAAIDGWVKWGGGMRPVRCKTMIYYRLRDGHEEFEAEAGRLRWRHLGGFGDIIAYKIHPKESADKENQE